MNSLYKLFNVILVSLICLVINPANSESEHSLLIVMSSESAYYREAAKEFTRTLISQKLPLTIRQTPVVDLVNALTEKPDIILAVGSKASLKLGLQETDALVINILLPRATHQKLAHQITDKKHLTGIYLDQPEQRLVNLTMLLPLEINSVGSVASSEEMAASARVLKEQFMRKQVEFNFQQMDEKQKPIQVLRPLFSDIDLFIALPDNTMFTRAIARWILNFSLQQNIPVLGFSAAYAEAGALLSIYSTPKQIGRQAAEIVMNNMNNGTLPPASGITPRYFEIKVNQAVVRKMGINPDRMKSSLLHSHLEEMETSDE